MPTTINNIIDRFEIPLTHRVKWGHKIPTEDEGIYIVSMCEVTQSNATRYDSIPLSRSILEDWIKQLNGFKIDKFITSDIDIISKRLSEFWLPDESILYIGKAPQRNLRQGLGNRVNEFYKTTYGKKRPHAGGHWIKALKILDDLHVHYFTCENSHAMEIKLLEYFISNVSLATRQNLRDKDLMLPFANLELKKGEIKKHGLGNMKK